MKKRVIFISNIELWSLGINKGGKAQISTIKGYINDGWDVYYISSAGVIPKDIENDIHYYFRSFPIIDRLSCSKFKLLHIFKYLKILALNIYYYNTVSNIIKHYENSIPTLIYAYEVDAVHAAKKISKKYKLSLITRFQGTVHTDTKDNIINRIRFAPHLSALKVRADMIIMTNDGTKGLEVLNRLNNTSSNIIFWMNGVKCVDISELLQRDYLRSQMSFENKYIFLTVSRLESWKRVDRAITAFAAISSDVEYAHLHIVGDGSERTKLENMAISYGVRNRIHFHGAIEQENVRHIMIASDCFLSLYDLSNVGNPLLEAMSCGKPIITLNNGDTSQFITNNITGVLLGLDEINKLPFYMRSFCDKKMNAEVLGNNARQYAVKKFWSWEQRINAELELANKLIS